MRTQAGHQHHPALPGSIRGTFRAVGNAYFQAERALGSSFGLDHSDCIPYTQKAQLEGREAAGLQTPGWRMSPAAMSTCTGQLVT